MNSTIQNLEIILAEKNVVTTIEKYFPSGNISIGSLLRKLPFLLMDLVDITKSTWCLNFLITDDSDIEVRLSETESASERQHLKIMYTARAHTGKKHAIQMLTKVFVHDKWVKIPVRESLVVLNKNNASFGYSKKLWISGDKSIYRAVFEMKPESQTWMQKIKTSFRKMLSEDTGVVETYKVLSTTHLEKKVL